MSVMMAPPIPLDGPLPVAPPYGLKTVAQEVTGDEPHWRGGAVVVPYPSAMPSAEDPCAIDSEALKDTPSALTIPEAFPAFRAYLGEICTAYSIGDWDAWKARANVALSARENWALERQLVTAQFVDAPALNDAEVTFPGGTSALASLTAVAWLEAAIAATGIAGVIHMPPPVATSLGDTLRDDRGTLVTPAGTPVIVGQGYWFVDSDTAGDATGGSSAGAGQSWIYATGPVQYRMGREMEALPEDISETLDRDDNTVVYRAERDLWVGWDTQLQAAALADWSP